jgi:hypothetical protein
MFIALLLAALARPASPALISSAPAYYPRLARVSPPSGAAFTAAVVEKPTAAARRLVFLAAAADGSWNSSAPGAVIASAPAAADGSVDLGNGFLLQLPNGTILCAYRHHDGAGAARTFRLQLAASHDLGASWALAATITSGPVGVWEPFLFRAAADGPQAVRVFYSAELTNGGEQDIVAQASADGGASWAAPFGRLHTPFSRNGMPGVAELPDASLLLVCEGFWGAAGWGHFTVNSARSFDGGRSWQQRSVVHAPPAGANAGSPQVALCGGAAPAACAVFMSSEGGGGGGAPWPGGAHAAALCAPLDGGAAAVPWARAGAPRAVAAATATIFWPSLLADAAGALRAAYQGDDAASYEAEGSLCSGA